MIEGNMLLFLMVIVLREKEENPIVTGLLRIPFMQTNYNVFIFLMVQNTAAVCLLKAFIVPTFMRLPWCTNRCESMESLFQH